jgi:hypothetical protein
MKIIMSVIGLYALISIGSTVASDTVSTNGISIVGISGSTNTAYVATTPTTKLSIFDFNQKIELIKTPSEPDYSFLIQIIDDAVPRDDEQIPIKDKFKPMEYIGATMDIIEEYGRSRTQLEYRFRVGRKSAFECGLESIDPSKDGVYIIKIGFSISLG